MVGRYNKFIRGIYLGGDLVLLNISFFLSFLIKFGTFSDFTISRYGSLILVINLLWVVLVNYLNAYTIERVTNIEKTFKSTLKLIFVHTVLTFSFLVLVKGSVYSREFLISRIVTTVILVIAWRLLVLYLLRSYRKSGFNYQRVVIIGSGPVGQQIFKYFNSDKSLGFKVISMFETKDALDGTGRVTVSGLKDIKSFILKNNIDEIYSTLPLTETEIIQHLMAFSDNNAIRLKLVPDVRGVSNRKLRLDFYEDVPVLSLRMEPLESVANRFAKRLFDIAFSILVLTCFVPFFLIIALIIKLSSKGPIFFKQERSGRGQDVFVCYKFRSMEMNKDADSLQAVKDDPRVTKIGAFMRKTNLDEIPQFINVLTGHMSVVGPRPHMLKHTEDYSAIIDRFKVRQFVKPGITGWAQVNGYRGATDNKKMRKRVQYDVWYIEHWSLLLDLRIIFLTVANMVKGEKEAF